VAQAAQRPADAPGLADETRELPAGHSRENPPPRLAAILGHAGHDGAGHDASPSSTQAFSRAWTRPCGDSRWQSNARPLHAACAAGRAPRCPVARQRMPRDTNLIIDGNSVPLAHHGMLDDIPVSSSALEPSHNERESTCWAALRAVRATGCPIRSISTMVDVFGRPPFAWLRCGSASRSFTRPAPPPRIA